MARVPAAPQPLRPAGYFGVPFRRQTYARLLYLLLSLPLSAVYFPLVVVSTVFPLLLPPMVFVWWAAADLERILARRLLGVAIPAPLRPSGPLGTRMAAMVRSTDTWRTAAYLALTLPFACVAFPLAVSLLAILLTYALAAPFYALSAHLQPAAPWLVGIQIVPLPFVGLVRIGGALSGPEQAVLALAAVLAVVLIPAALGLLGALAGAWGRAAVALLSESPGSRRLRAAEEAAERERTRAEQADRKRRELIVNASHELRTPVAAIRAHLESLLMATDPETERSLPREELRGYLGIAHRESERMGALVDDLLALARAEAGELRLDLGPVRAAEVCAEVCAALAPLAKRERQVTLVHDAVPGLPRVTADRQRLGQVLENLVRNAVTHTPEGGIVSLTLRAAGPGFLELCVADTGSGIAPEELDRIFERFYRTDASRARASGGFGLGLAIVRDLVAAMGGTITAESVPGQGSTFRLHLAVAPPADRGRR